MEEFASKKILVLFCGGLDFNQEISDPELQEWIRDFFELQMVAKAEAKLLYSGPGSGISLDLWPKLAQEVFDNFNDYDGFVVSHGLDNVLATSNMLSNMLVNLSKPVIFTGSTRLVSDNHKQGLEKVFKKYNPIGFSNNLLKAVQAANLAMPGVFLFYDHNLISPQQAEINGPGKNIFSYPAQALKGHMDFGFSLDQPAEVRVKKLELKNNFCRKIKLLDLSVLNLDEIDLDKYEGLAVKGYFEDLELKLETQRPVLVMRGENYKFQDNFISGAGYSWEAGVCRLMWALGQSQEVEEVKRLIQGSL